MPLSVFASMSGFGICFSKNSTASMLPAPVERVRECLEGEIEGVSGGEGKEVSRGGKVG